jgi:hypothetical protein
METAILIGAVFIGICLPSSTRMTDTAKAINRVADALWDIAKAIRDRK